ncbi:MAG: hypothetical protein N2115_00170, partial [bacterium]|nr:hypothetical protein [bacterium]
MKGLVSAGFLLLCAAVFASDQSLRFAFENDGAINIENSLISFRVSPRTTGIESWKNNITGFEMVDLLYGQTDYLKGHLLSEIWDSVTMELIPSGRPEYGNFYVPAGISLNKEKNVLAFRQVTEDKYRFTKDIIVRKDFGVIEVRLNLTNLQGIPVGSSLRLHNIFSPGARGKYQKKNDTLFIKTEKGVLQLNQSLILEKYYQVYGNDKFFNRHRENEPSREWVNPKVIKTPLLVENWAVWVNNENGDGMIFIVDGDNFLGYYNCPGITLEPVMRAFSLKRGESFKTSLYIGSFTGLKDKVIVHANPLFIEIEELKKANSLLKGEILPLWKGFIEITGKGKIIERIPVSPDKTIRLDVKVDEDDWLLKALDSDNKYIGEMKKDRTIYLTSPVLEFPEKKKPKVTTRVFFNREQINAMRNFIEKKEFTIFCSYKASDTEKNIANEISKLLGVGISWINPGGEILVVGNPETNQTCRNIGLWKNSVDSLWPGKGKGAILFYSNYEETQRPVLLIT